MATTYLGNDIKVYLRERGSTGAWLELVCNEELSLTLNRNVIERVTKCGTLKRSGQLNSEVPFTGVSEFAPTGSQVSHNQLLDWQIANTELELKIADASAGATKVDIEADCSITDFEVTFTVDDYVGFSGTLSISGDPVNNL